jgi:hypothetical protein
VTVIRRLFHALVRGRQGCRSSCRPFLISTVLSLAAFMTVRCAAQPVIVRQPADQLNIPLQSPASFEVLAQGKGNLRYQWRHNGSPIPTDGPMGPVLSFTAVFPVNAGTYDVVVFDDVGFVASQRARLTLALPPGQFSDNFLDAGRRPVFEPSGLVGFNNFKATREPNEPLHDGKTGTHSVWMTWVAPVGGGFLHLDTVGSGFDTLLAVYTGKTLDTLVRINSDDDSGSLSASSLVFSVTPGEVYQIAVDGRLKSAGDIVFHWNLVAGAGQPAIIYDQPKNQVVPAGGDAQFVVTYSPDGALVEWLFNGQVISQGAPLVGAVGNVLKIPGVDASKIGRYRARITSQFGPTTVAVSQPAILQFSTSDGKPSADTFAEDKYTDLTDPGTFIIRPALLALAALHSDRFHPDNAPARGYSGTQIFSTVGASAEPGEPVHCGAGGGVSEWYAIQAESNGFLTVDTSGSSFDTVLAVYVDPADTGTLEGLVSVACNNDIAPGVNLQSTVTFPCVQNTVYYVAVDGVGGATGSAALHYFLNRLPTVSDIANTTINEDQPTAAIPFTINDAETPAGSLSLTVNSSDAALLPPANIALGGSGSSRTVTATPVANASGLATITITVTDGNGASAGDSFTVTVNPVNDAPTLDQPADRALGINPGPQTVNLSGITSGAPNETQTLTVTAASSNPALIPAPSVNYTSPNATGSLTFTPQGGGGSALITVTVNDGGAQNPATSRAFTVTVAGNQPPTIGAISNQQTPQDTPAGPIGFSIGDAETAAASLIVSASSSNQTVVPDGNIALSAGGAVRTVTITPAAGQTGDVNITITVMDANGATASRTFLLHIGAGNHAPVAAPQSVTVTRDTPAAITLTGSDSDGNPLSYQVVASPSKGTLSGIAPALTYTPNSGITGTDNFTFKVNDGSVDSATATISIVISDFPPIQFKTFSATATQFKFTLSAPAGHNYLIEWSNDMKTWSSAATLPSTTGTISYFDLIAGNKAVFYRAKVAQ